MEEDGTSDRLRLEGVEVVGREGVIDGIEDGDDGSEDRLMKSRGRGWIGGRMEDGTSDELVETRLDEFEGEVGVVPEDRSGEMMDDDGE